MKSQPQKATIHHGRKLAYPKGRIPSREWLNTVTDGICAVLGITAVEVDEEGKETGRQMPGATMTPNGGIKLPVPKSSSGSDGSAGSEKGEWTPNYPGGYPIYAKVVVRGGVNAGYYMSLKNANADVPWNASSWLQLANNNAQGRW